jgi:predicted DNA-binding transcriptional regulator YafY
VYHSLIQILTAARLIARPQGATKSEIANAVGLSERSVYRLIQSLECPPPEGLGYPIYDEPGKPTRWKLNSDRDTARWWLPIPGNELDWEDRIILNWLLEKAVQIPALAESVSKLRKKLDLTSASAGVALPRKQTGAGPESGPKPMLLYSYKISKPQPEHADEKLRTIFRAISDRQVCHVSYEAISTGQVKSYDIHPLAVFENDGGIYLYVVVPYYGDIRLLAFERIRAIETVDGTFEFPLDFDIEKRLADPFGIVQGDEFEARIWFSAEQAPYIREKKWPSHYRIEERANGEIILHLTTCGEYELTRWILSYGADAVVLEPEWLRESIGNCLKVSIKRYREKEFA